MRKTLLLLALFVSLETSAFATWSVIAVDRSTQRVVMAAASCVNTDDEAMKTAIAVIVPGVGVAACQAAADGTHQNQMVVFQELQKYIQCLFMRLVLFHGAKHVRTSVPQHPVFLNFRSCHNAGESP